MKPKLYLKFFRGASEFFIDGYTEREDFEFMSVPKNKGTLKESDVEYYLSERGLNREDYTLVYDLNNIIY